ncbi:MAG: hypothetical protein AAFO94_08900 [Bacteroidota bacterium]
MISILKNKINFVGLLLFLAGALVHTSVLAQESFVTLERDDIPRRLLRKFKRDAARLALRMEADKEDLRYQNISIPRGNVESIFKVLTNIYVSHETAQSIAKCKVHTFPDPAIDNFKVVFKRNVEWAGPLREGITETNSAEINELLDEFDLVIQNHQKWTDDEDIITISSKTPLNMAALANEFYNIQGVESIDLGIPEISGNDIVINRVSGGWEVEYVLRFGAYVDGKGKDHRWKYRAMDSGDIKFIEETGDPIPDWMRCELEEDMQLLAKDR